MWKTISVNVAGHLVSSALMWGIGLLMTPMLVKHLGPVQFGMMALATSVVGQLGILDLGLSQTLVRRSAELFARNDFEELSRTVSTILAVYIGIGVCGLAVTLVSARLLSTLFRVQAGDRQLFEAMLYLVGFQVAVSFPCYVWTGLLAGLQKTYINNVVNTTAAIFRGIGMFILLVGNHGVLAILGLQFALTVLSGIVSAVALFRLAPSIRIRLRFVRRRSLQDSWQSAGSMFLWGIAGRVQTDAGRFALGITQNFTSVAVYEVGLRLASQARIITNAMITLLPTAVAVNESDSPDRLVSIYIRCTKFLLLAYATVFLLVAVFGRAFVSLWLGRQFTGGALVLSLIVAGSLYQSQSFVIHLIMGAIGRYRIFNWVNAGYALVGLPLCFLMSWRWDYTGAAVATLVTFVLVESATLYKALPILKISMRSVLTQCHIPVGIAMIGPATIALGCRQAGVVDDWRAIGIVCFVTGLAVIAGAATFLMSREERKAFVDRLPRRARLLSFDSQAVEP